MLFNTRLDWSVTDTKLLVWHFGGQRALICIVCSSHGQHLSGPKLAIAEVQQLSVVLINHEQSFLQGPAPEIRLPTELQTSVKKKGASLETILSGHPSTSINIAALSSYLSSHPWCILRGPSNFWAFPRVSGQRSFSTVWFLCSKQSAVCLTWTQNGFLSSCKRIE